MITARSTPNIALIKYWGNRNNDFRLPAADSLSMTLDSPHVEISVEPSEEFSVTSDRTMREKDIERFKKHFELTKRYLTILGIPEVIPQALSIEIHSQIPPGIGLASSAAVFGALAKAIAGLVRAPNARSEKKHAERGFGPRLSDEQISVIARLGAGSAARSIFGGYAALHAGKGETIDSSSAKQIANENHWLLHDIVLVPSQEEKKIGSTEGHAMAWTSPLFTKRLEELPRRNRECRDAIVKKDFEKLQRISEEDALDMHRVMETQDPPLRYLSDETHRIIREITALRQSQHLPVLYTMDAGPTVHLLCPDETRVAVLDYANMQKNCQVFETRVGRGATIIADGSAK